MSIGSHFSMIPHEASSPPGQAPVSTLITKDGKKHKVEEKIIQRGTAWKVLQGTQAFFLTLLTLGIGLAFRALRDKWKQAVTGEEKITLYTRVPSESLSTSKVAQITAARLSTSNPEPAVFTSPISPPKPVSPPKSASLSSVKAKLKEVTDFIDTAKTNITKISFNELEKELDKALAMGSSIHQPEDKTTILVVAERVAQHYIHQSNFPKALEVRLRAAQQISPAPPLSDFQTLLKDEHLKLGLRIHLVDTSLFKNHSLLVQKRQFTDGTTRLHFNAKLSHPARAQLETSFQIQPNQLLKALPKDFCTNVKITDEHTTYQGRLSVGDKKWEGNFSSNSGDGFEMMGHTCKVFDFEGVGKVKIGNDLYCLAEYNRITIDLDPHVSEAEAADKLNIIFAALGLGAVASSSRAEDTERIKIMQLFRAFYPQEAYTFERDPVTFEESIESLKTRIAAKVPEMSGQFQHYLVDHPEEMYQQEVYPGQPVWCVKGLAEAAKREGAIGLMSSLTGVGNDFDEAGRRLASILKSGILSTQDRFQAGIMAKGESAEADLASGGAESVFARMITYLMPLDPSQYPFGSSIHLLYDLQLVERVGYVYEKDQYGVKAKYAYGHRSNVIDLTKKIQSEPLNHLGNEICIRNRIGPEFIKGVIVQDAAKKDLLMNALRQEGVLSKNSLDQECVNNVPVDQFIHIGNFQADYWT